VTLGVRSKRGPKKDREDPKKRTHGGREGRMAERVERAEGPGRKKPMGLKI